MSILHLSKLLKIKIQHQECILEAFINCCQQLKGRKEGQQNELGILNQDFTKAHRNYISAAGPKTGRVPVEVWGPRTLPPNTQFWTPAREGRGRKARVNGKMRASRGNCGKFKLFKPRVQRVLDVMSARVLFQLILEITPNHKLSLF